MYRLLLISSAPDAYLGDNLRDGADESKAYQFRRNNRRTGLEREHTRRKETREEADHRNRGGQYQRRSEPFGQAHRRECRENNQSGNHDRPHHFHADHDGHAGQNRQNNAEHVRIDSGGSGEGFIEGDGKDRFAAEEEPAEDNRGQN